MNRRQAYSRRSQFSPAHASRGYWLVLALLALTPVALPIEPPPVAAPGDRRAPGGASTHGPAIQLAQRDCEPRQSMVFGGPQPAVPRAGGGLGTAPAEDCDEPRRRRRDYAPRDSESNDHPAYQPDAHGDGRPPREPARRKPAWAW